MWVVFGLGLLIAVGFLVFLITCCRLPPSPAALVNRWCTPLSERRLAESRSQTLLREMLSEGQYHQVLACGYLDITSPSLADRVYRIPSKGGLVGVFEHGCVIMGLCLQPTEPLPTADVVVMHKLLIEANEQEYLYRANHLAPSVLRPQGSNPL